MKNSLKVVVGLALASAGTAAFAATGGGLPWDGPMMTFTNDLTGPVASTISVGALAGAGGALIFRNDELSGFAKTLLFTTAGIATMVGGYNLLSALGLAGATI